ncbi:tRNA pseudouridine(55) synthase TruB [Saccharopolyspora spinosa]|uniref:tRNA pseudouridine synthase B n=1 Tax=Saccharopolyspora spinosa TaxID=60894 RepID=A0A2N3Y9E8_SACSN|nr:tRNA pseudouridine(55) synthase TruB [Saccharopolyspora spinosa]PKW19481.1 tRNA pseudouridine synthase B [Saccharopolyspora spinosa]
MSERSRKTRPTVPPGLLVIDKPAGMTSHDVVSRVRRIMGTRRVGHAGTLDPMATGVLVLGLERATKLLGHLALDTKAYLATIRLGAATTTDDAEGDVVSEVDASAVDEEAIRAGIAELTGDIQQVPSAVSAVKINGRRAYELARNGESVELAARPVTVSRFDVLALRRTERTTDLDVLVECSSGTYVRALARDLGAGLGAGGHLAELRRTRVGPFGLVTARTLEQLESEPALSMSLDQAVEAAFPRRNVDSTVARALSHGQVVPAAGVEGTYGMFDPDGRAVALVRDRGRTAKAVLVIVPAN